MTTRTAVRVGLSLGEPAAVVTRARRAEQAGFDLVSVGEHLFHHGPAPNPWVQLAAVAAATRRVRLLTSMTLLPLYPAALAAKLAATLDVVSGGRLDLGLGAGGEHPPEFLAVGVDPGERFRRLDEGMDVLQRLFAGGPVHFDGEFTTLRGEVLDPAPLQRGGPPLWLGGRRGPALRRVARAASCWIPYMVTPRQFADGLAEVRRATAAAGRDPDAVGRALFAFVAVDEDGARARRDGVAAVSATYHQDFSDLADRFLLLGSPDQVVERIGDYVDAGVRTVVLHVAATPTGQDRVLDLLAERVLPQLRGAGHG